MQQKLLNDWKEGDSHEKKMERVDGRAAGNPDAFVCGHSHILKVQYDQQFKFLTMNPGAAGKQGWQPCQTLLRFTIDGAKIDNLEVIELERIAIGGLTLPKELEPGQWRELQMEERERLSGQAGQAALHIK